MKWSGDQAYRGGKREKKGSNTTLVATLGGQPQVVTFTLDLLLAKGEPIDQVVVVYMASGERYREAYQLLAGEFSGDRYAGRSCHLRKVAVEMGKTILADARTPEEVEAIRKTFFELLSELRAQEQRIHLSLTGGRRIMALTALAAAMQHLTPADSLWHIYTPPEFTDQARDGKIMHAPAEAGVRLMAVPFVAWAAYFPGLRPLLERPSRGGQSQPFVWLDDQEKERCRQVWEALTKRQQDALYALVNHPDRKRAAAYLGISINTVDTHKGVIAKKCSEVWELAGKAKVDLKFLNQHFAPFLASLDREWPG